MQKITFFLFFITVSLFLNAQVSFQLFDLQGNNITNDTVTVIGSIDSNEVDFYAHIKNTSTSFITTICKKTVIDTSGSSMNFFCFGPNCYVGISSNPVNIGAGIEDTTYHSYIYPSGTIGETKVLYTFYDTLNMSDSVNVFVKFKMIDASAITLSNLNTTFLNKPFPSPANEFVQFDYQLAQGDIAAIVFYNILGNEVGRYFLSSDLKQIRINTSELKTGIFIYAFIVDGKKEKIGRLMVKH